MDQWNKLSENLTTIEKNLIQVFVKKFSSEKEILLNTY